jgi:ferritin-like metal-binding protein YciE
LSKEATSHDLRAGFEALIRQTREHVARLARILRLLLRSPEGKHFKGMAGLIREDTEMIADDQEPQELDVRLIAAVRVPNITKWQATDAFTLMQGCWARTSGC